jgi:hypothetical protein
VRGVIGQITHHLDHMAEMLLYYFLLGPREKGDAHRYDFADIKTWQRPKTDATKRMDKLVNFISKHRAHLSMTRFDPPYPDIEELIGVRSITAEFLGQVLLDYLDILDSFIAALPEGTEKGKGLWQGAAYSARHKTEISLGVRESDHPEHLKPLKSVAARKREAQ